MSFCFIHAADLHLDTTVTGVSTPPEPLFRALRDASLTTFAALVTMAIERNARLVLLTGDIYDGPEVGPRARVRFQSGVERLSREGITTVILSSPRDSPSHAWMADFEAPGSVHLVHAESPPVTIEADGEAVATIQVLHGDWARSLPPDLPGFQIGIAFPDAVDVNAAASAGIQYVALGGSHCEQVRSERPWFVDPGTMQGRSLQPNERGPKGAMLVTVEETRVQSVEFVSLASVQFEEITMDVSEFGEIDEVRMILNERATAPMSPQDGGMLVASAVLTGTGPVHEALIAPGAGPRLLQALRSNGAAATADVWWSDLRDETGRERDLDAIHNRGDIAAELLTTARMLLDQPELAAQALAQLPATIPLEPGDAGPLLIDAEKRALDLLERPEEA